MAEYINKEKFINYIRDTYGGPDLYNSGSPMTDEAMQMVMERLEALHDTGN